MEESRQTTDIPFVNEIVMNEYTLREIMPDLWTRKASRNRLPLTLQPDTLHYPLPLLQSPLLFTIRYLSFSSYLQYDPYFQNIQ